MKIGYIGNFKAKPGKRDDLAELLLQAEKLVQSAQGCRQYLIALDSSDAYTVTVLEIWDSQEEHDASLDIPGCRELINQAMSLLDGTPEGRVLEVIGGKRP